MGQRQVVERRAKLVQSKPIARFTTDSWEHETHKEGIGRRRGPGIFNSIHSPCSDLLSKPGSCPYLQDTTVPRRRARNPGDVNKVNIDTADEPTHTKG